MVALITNAVSRKEFVILCLLKRIVMLGCFVIFMAQLTGCGGEGGSDAGTGTGTGNLYSAIYEALPPAGSSSGFITQANAEGAKGYEFINNYSFSGSFASIYVKDNSQSSTF